MKSNSTRSYKKKIQGKAHTVVNVEISTAVSPYKDKTSYMLSWMLLLLIDWLSSIFIGFY